MPAPAAWEANDLHGPQWSSFCLRVKSFLAAARRMPNAIALPGRMLKGAASAAHSA